MVIKSEINIHFENMDTTIMWDIGKVTVTPSTVYRPPSPKQNGIRGLAVACWTTAHYHPSSNLGVGIFEGCFIFNFASLPLEVVRPI